MQGTVRVMTTPATVSVPLPVEPRPEAWILTEGIVPEALFHDEAAEKLKALLDPWAASCATPTRIARNLAFRFYESDQRVGIDPDVCVFRLPPDPPQSIGSICLWKPEHVPPSLCFEVVSKNHPHKDYREIQERYAALGTHELIVFDPMLYGPKSLGGPVPLQLWRRDADRSFDRVHFGAEPVYSEVLGAWVIPAGLLLHIANDRAGKDRWLSEAERQREEAERQREEAERQRAEVERLRAELRAALAKK